MAFWIDEQSAMSAYIQGNKRGVQG